MGLNCRHVVCFFLFLALSAMVGAQDGGLYSSIPDNSPARRASLQSIITLPLTSLASLGPQSIRDPLLPGPVRVEVRPGQGDSGPTIWFIGPSSGTYDQGSAGTVSIERAKTGVSISAVSMVLAPQSQVKALIKPLGNGTVSITVQVLEQDYLAWRNVRFAIPIESFVTMPIQRMLELTGGRIQWGEVLWSGNNDIFAPQRALINTIRPILARLPDAEDGAMDQEGRLVKIATGALARLPGFNCSGFAKWLVDGFYAPLIKKISPLSPPLLSIEALKERHIDHRGNERTLPWEELRDPFFGLDWTRNLAVILAQTRGEYAPGPESRDLRDPRGSSYVEDKGYQAIQLPLVLYLAAIRDPQRWYLVSINGEWGSDPVLWQHYHIAAVFPYFDSNGVFKLSVFERNVETSWESLLRRYPRTYAHAVWFNILGDFSPLTFN